MKAEPTAVGRATAKARGRTDGPPRTDPEKLEHAWILYLHSHKTAVDVCRTVGIGRRTLSSYLAQIRKRADTASSQSLKAISIRDDHVRGLYTFRPRPPTEGHD